MLGLAGRGALLRTGARHFSASSSLSSEKTSHIAEYKVVDHAYDAVVVGAGKLFLLIFLTSSHITKPQIGLRAMHSRLTFVEYLFLRSYLSLAPAKI